MSEQQISKLAGVFVEHQGRLAALSNADRQWAIQNMPDAIALFSAAVKNRTQKLVKELFQFLRAYTVPAVKKFVVAEKYAIDTSPNARVRISYLGDNFKKQMLPKVEEDVPGGELRMSKLLERSRDVYVSADKPGTIVSLGGEVNVKVTLCDFYETLAEKQARGDYTWAVAFAEDVKGVLSAVDAYWDGDGWDVGCHSIDNPDVWDAGNEFVSRDP